MNNDGKKRIKRTFVNRQSSIDKGKVYIIGAGPGDPGLITLKGVECIKMADVIVYDYLANRCFLKFAKEGVEAIHVGKRGFVHTMPQEDINRLLIEKAMEGKVVARLKGGDPFIFGRGGEEALVLAEAGIPFEIVPGVSSAVAAPAYAGIPLTHRSYNSTVAFITGHEDPEKGGSSIAWDKIATGIETLIFLMGMKNLSQNIGRLIENGRDPKTPAALIRWGTKPEQETIVGTLGTIVDLARERNFKPPVVVVVGEVVCLRERLNWFETKPLFGKRIVITRTREQAGEFAELLACYGAEPIEFPTIEVVPPDSWVELDRAIEGIEGYNWLIFTSVNGVRFFMERLKLLGKDVRDLKGIKICAIGPKTAEKVESFNIKADLMPEEYKAEGVVEALGEREIKGKRFLLPRALEAREVLPQKIRKLGGRIDIVTAYKTIRPKGKAEEIRGLLKEKAIDLVTFTSSGTVSNFAGMFQEGEAKKLLNGIPVGCIGPITAKTAEDMGIKVSFMPAKYTIPALAEETIRFFGWKG